MNEGKPADGELCSFPHRKPKVILDMQECSECGLDRPCCSYYVCDGCYERLRTALREIELHVHGHISWYIQMSGAIRFQDPSNNDRYFRACTKPADIARTALAESKQLRSTVEQSGDQHCERTLADLLNAVWEWSWSIIGREEAIERVFGKHKENTK